MSALGAEGRRFESCLPDHKSNTYADNPGERTGNDGREDSESGTGSHGIVPEDVPETFRRRLGDGELARARARCASTPRTTFRRQVYFAAAPDGPIKIGMSCDPRRRLRELRTKTGQDLRLLATCPGAGVGSFTEDIYHRRFFEHALGGEWFSRHPDILAEIARVNEAHQPSDRRVSA